MSSAASIRLRNMTAKPELLNDALDRDDELRQLIRLLLRPLNHHAVIIGQPGIGKSSLVELLARGISQQAVAHIPNKIYLLDSAPILSLFVSGENPRSCFDALRTNIAKLDSAIIVIEDIQLLASDDPGRLELTLELLQTISANPNIRLIVTTTQTAYERVFRDDYVFGRTFSPLELTELASETIAKIVQRDAGTKGVDIEPDALKLFIEYGGRYGHGRALPDAALRLVEEATVKSVLDGHGHIDAANVREIVAESERIPLASLDTSENKHQLASLNKHLNQAVIGQPVALRTISRTIVNAELGLGDDSRPRGSFLLLGPSGVGKTETAKALTHLVYQNPKALVRLDMSEYSEAHSAVRLIGSPPGYVGYEEGGQLTGAVSRQPYSLVLLDEIEKAHPKLFDVFLQLLDDGRLTDSSGKTVDFTHSMVLATSNIGSKEIADSAASGVDVSSPSYLQDTLLPLLMQHFRPEFLNRFDAILVYRPLAVEQLVDLAQRELAKLEQRLARHDVSFDVSDSVLHELLRAQYNPLFGARPVRRLIANHFEMPIAEQLIDGQLQSPTIITGAEPWLG